MICSVALKRHGHIAAMLVIITLLSMSGQVYATGGHWYTGYCLYGGASYAEEGLRGRTYTIDAPGLSTLDSMFEYTLVVLSYQNNYWLEWGYMKSWYNQYFLKYYWAKRDSYSQGGAPMIDDTGPIPGTWHTYYHLHPYGYDAGDDPAVWELWRDGEMRHWTFMYPNTAVDQQAMAETISTTIVIDGTHFKDLAVWTIDRYWHWVKWLCHFPVEMPPYDLTEVSNYEFYGNGGG
jgi:hypothetical protein